MNGSFIGQSRADRAVFTAAKMGAVDLVESLLSRAQFASADLTSSKLIDSIFTGADLTEAKLESFRRALPPAAEVKGGQASVLRRGTRGLRRAAGSEIVDGIRLAEPWCVRLLSRCPEWPGLRCLGPS